MKNPSHGTQLRAERECEAQKSKNVMPDCSCCLVLAVPASLNIWLFFLKTELLVLNYQGWMMQGSHLHPGVCALSSLLSFGSTKTSLCFPSDCLNHHTALRGDMGHSCPLGERGHLSRKEWSGAGDTVGSEHNLCWEISNGQAGSTGSAVGSAK